MSRESCIAHSPKQAIAIVRQDYYELMERDACAAALLNLFEYWANAALAVDATLERPWIGARPIREFEHMLLGIATDKQIRKRLALLKERGFIRDRAPEKRGKAKEYQVCLPEIQHALFGQITEVDTSPRSYNQTCLGQITDYPSVIQPIPLRSNDRALKKNSKEYKKEDFKEARFAAVALEQEASKQETFEPAPQQSAQSGAVQYTQPPETINLADLWATHPGLARAKLRFIAPNHKRLEMVAHGFGHWWIGPQLNDFDEYLIKACQQRKRKLEQPDSVSDAKTFINNLIRRGDWANFSLRCDEAKVLRDRALASQRVKDAAQVTKAHTQTTTDTPTSAKAVAHAQQSRIQLEQRQAAIGLAKFKVSRGEIKRAKEIADQLRIAYSDVGIAA